MEKGFPISPDCAVFLSDAHLNQDDRSEVSYAYITHLQPSCGHGSAGKREMSGGLVFGAGEGNRTLISGLGSPHSTTEPHPLPKNCITGNRSGELMQQLSFAC